MEIYIRDGTGQCPCCKGMLYPVHLHLIYRCIDCRAAFKASGAGYDKNSITVDSVGIDSPIGKMEV